MKSIPILLAAVLMWASGMALAGPIPSSPIYTSKLRFRIPFHYDSNELKRLGAREIRLFVSRDRGRNWQQVQAVAPQAGKFNFEAQSDGEYWFIVRTLDARNQLHPDDNNNEPGLQVIVDTTAPRLQLELKQPVPGKVQLSWNASDEHLDPTQLRLEYTQPGTSDWQPVSVVPKAAGQTGWSIPQGGVVAVRGSISDFARNTARDQVERRVAAASQTVPRPRTPDLRQPVAGSGLAPHESQSLSMADRFPGSDVATVKSPANERVGSAPSDTFGKLPLAGATPARRDSLVSQQVDTFTGEQESDQAGFTGDESPEKAPRARQRVVGNRRFQIGYKLQDVATEEVAAVELFITQDHGATWYRYGVDDDRKSPFRVEVPSDGTYGFTLGIRTAGGQSIDAPQNGNPPSLEVVVDQTAPKIELLPLKRGRGTGANKILIEWKYTDDFPAERPISLAYAENPAGPWEPIASGIENSGRYVWTVDAAVPSKFFVRVEARDEAGNVESAATLHPVLFNLTRPTAQFLDVETPQ